MRIIRGQKPPIVERKVRESQVNATGTPNDQSSRYSYVDQQRVTLSQINLNDSDVRLVNRLSDTNDKTSINVNKCCD